LDRLAELGHEARIDHRSFKGQGIDLEPQNKIELAGARRESRTTLRNASASH
jgi:hypothetical protein